MTTFAPADNNILTEDSARAANQMMAKLEKLGIVPNDEPEVTPSGDLTATLIVFKSGVVDITLNTWTREARFSYGADKPLRITLVPFGDMAPADMDTILAFFGNAERVAAEAAKMSEE